MLTPKEMLETLISLGMSQAHIANQVGLSQPTIHRILEKGQTVSYEGGKEIERLYSEAVDQKAA